MSFLRAHSFISILFSWALTSPALGDDLSGTNKAAYNLLHPVPAALLREWHTDFAGVSPYTTDAGHFEAQMFPLAYGYWSRNLGSSTFRAESWTFGNTVLKAGLLNNLDLEFGIIPYQQVTSTQKGSSPAFHFESRQTFSGFGDSFSRLKLNVWGNDGGKTALAFSGFVKFPTAADGLGNGQFEGGPGLEFGADLPYGFELRINSIVDLFEFQGRQASFENLLSVIHGIAGPLRGFVQFNTLVFTTSTDWTSQLRTGLMYRLTANIETEAEIGFGLNGGFADYAPALGIAVRF